MKKETKHNLFFALTFFVIIFSVMAGLYIWVKKMLILLYDIMKG